MGKQIGDSKAMVFNADAQILLFLKKLNS